MKQKNKQFYVILLAVWLLVGSFSSCITDQITNHNIGMVEGLRPIYVSSDSWQTIKASEARSIKSLGKIYYKDQIIFVNESNEGVHVINNNDPENPEFLLFIEIPGCTDISIKGNYMYANNVTDLVTIDLSDWENPTVVNRIENVNQITNQSFPENYDGYFECVDASQGTIISWEAATLDNPQCRG